MNPRIRNTVAIAVAVLSIGACSRQQPVVAPAPPPPPPTFQFVAVTGADSAMEGRFEGTATLADNWLQVVVPRSTITVPPGNSENWRNLTVRAFLATDYQPGLWKAVAQSRPVNVFRFIDFGRTNWSDRRTLPIEQEFRFMVPVPPGASLATSRIAIELEWVFVVGEYGETESRIAFSGPLPPP
jgi:hypothetical protein